MAKHPHDRGASAVEFALVAPVLIALLLGIISFGHAFHVQSMLSNAARDAVRIVALPDAEGEYDPVATAVETAKTSALPTVLLSNDHIHIDSDSCTDNESATPQTATVEINYHLQLLGGIGSVDLTGKGTMRCEG